MEDERWLSREDDTVLFELDILESFDEIIDELKQSPQTMVYHEAKGLTVDAPDVPASLQQFLGTSLESLEVNIEFDPSAERYETAITPPDSLPIMLRSTQGIEEIEHDNQLYVANSSNLMYDAMLLVIPKPYRSLQPSFERLAEYVVENSPSSHQHYVFLKEEKNGVRYGVVAQCMETEDDSLRELQIIHTTAHPSGRDVGTRMRLTESVKRSDVTSSLHIEVINTDDGEHESPMIDITLDRNQFQQFEPPHISKLHMANIFDTLSELRQSTKEV